MNLNYKKVNDDITEILTPPGRKYYLLLGTAILMTIIGIYSWWYQIQVGIGASGKMHPVMWRIYITDFVFWVGIAHSGTLISAILFLFRTKWRTSIFRAAEAATVFAVMTAGLFPIIHMGRPWFFYWLFPYPNQRFLWPNFKSPLMWDVFAISTYFAVSVMFFYMGMIPDIAVIRNRASGLKKKIYGLLSLGWTGSAKQWNNYFAAYGFLAALATPLVVSVHSIVSWDFAMANVPGWHSTIFAPYFVAGAIHSGLAMVITILIPMRKIFKLEEYITIKHFESMAKVIILTGLIVGYAYYVEFFIAWYSNNPFEWDVFVYRAIGDIAPQFWMMVIFNTILPLLFFFKKIRTNLVWLLIICIFVNIGMWLERYVIITTSLGHEYEPYSWGISKTTLTEIGITVGSFGWFFMWFFIFVKLLPSLAITELKESLPLPGLKEEHK